MAESPNFRRAIAALEIQLRQKKQEHLEVSLQIDFEGTEEMVKNLSNKIEAANKIREELNQKSFVSLLKLIKTGSKKSNIVRTNQKNKEAPIPKYYPKMRQMVRKSDKKPFSPLAAESLRRKSLNRRLRTKRFGWNFQKSIFDKADPKNIVKMEKKSFFNNKKFKDINYKNKKSKVANEISNFMDKTRRRFYRFRLKPFQQQQENGKRKMNKWKVNAMQKMKNMMRSSMLDIDFKL